MNGYEIALRDLEWIEWEFGINYYFNFEAVGFNDQRDIKEAEKELGDWYGN